MKKVLLSTDQFAGHQVAFLGSDNDTVIAAGNDPKEVFDMAHKRGIDRPVIVVVPEKDSVLMYTL